MLAAISDYVVIGIGILGAIIALAAIVVVLNFGSLWIRARAAETRITFGELIGMWLRRVNSSLIVNTKIQAWKAGITDITTQDLENHYLAGGNVANVVRALVLARQRGGTLDFRRACQLDLGGKDAAQMAESTTNDPDAGDHTSAAPVIRP